ncbi:unnamed protein product [Linum trigynum]|uniref:Uncharacterized protein n=1 Tax=Linum trigynum TaxID=586398 RepID=A0AAV2EPY0_9ROSI
MGVMIMQQDPFFSSSEFRRQAFHRWSQSVILLFSSFAATRLSDMDGWLELEEESMLATTAPSPDLRNGRDVKANRDENWRVVGGDYGLH